METFHVTQNIRKTSHHRAQNNLSSTKVVYSKKWSDMKDVSYLVSTEIRTQYRASKAQAMILFLYKTNPIILCQNSLVSMYAFNK